MTVGVSEETVAETFVAVEGPSLRICKSRWTKLSPGSIVPLLFPAILPTCFAASPNVLDEVIDRISLEISHTPRELSGASNGEQRAAWQGSAHYVVFAMTAPA